MKDVQNRFWSKVRKTTDDSCWTWQAGRSKNPRGKPGYGCFYLGSRVDRTRRMHAAHRVAWELTNGPIPDGMKVLHRCDNVVCVRPDHLFLGTQGDNVKDMIAKGRKVAARGSRQGSAKLTEEQVKQIRAAYQKGSRGPSGAVALACKYGVTRGTITDIATRAWRHL